MMTVQRRLIELIRIRSKQLDADELTIPAFLRLTQEQRRLAWIRWDAAQHAKAKGAGLSRPAFALTKDVRSNLFG